MGSLGGLSPGGSIAIGILVGLISTSVQSLGLTLQRKSHILEDEKGPHDVRRPPHRRRRWQLGMGMFVVSNILGSSVQISTLPLPVLSTLQAAGLVFNSICATLILGEPFTRWSLWGTCLVCSGAILIAIFGAIPSPAHSLRELLELLARGPFITWMSLQAVFVIAIAVVTDSAAHFSKSLSQNARFRLLRGLAYGCISGILSAHSLLFAKSAVELILRTIADGDNQFVHWQSWMLVLGLVTLALSQLYYLHRGLKLVSTSVLYPLVFCIYNIIAILDGLIYFNQVDQITPLQGGLIALGTAILLSGVLALSWRLSEDQHQPAVGQSSLAPGLGLVEDTEGEEESLNDSDTITEEEDDIPPTTVYQTFGPPERRDSAGAAGTPLTPGRKRSTRWAERREIWDELEDQEELSSPLLTTPSFSRRRSSTLPASQTEASESTSLLPPRRGVSGGSPSVGPSSSREDLSTSKRGWRRRRKSSGFPGFTARKSRRKSSSGVQDALGGIWKLKWFKGKDEPSQGSAPATPSGSRDVSGASTLGRYRDEEEAIESPSLVPYRDDENAVSDDGSRPNTGQSAHDRGKNVRRNDDAAQS